MSLLGGQDTGCKGRVFTEALTEQTCFARTTGLQEFANSIALCLFVFVCWWSQLLSTIKAIKATHAISRRTLSLDGADCSILSIQSIMFFRKRQQNACLVKSKMILLVGN